MVLSAVFITDLQGKLIISRNYRGDVPITRSIERFAKYIHDTPEEHKKPIFQADTNSEFYVEDDVGCTGNDGETYVYINVSLLCKRIQTSFLCFFLHKFGATVSSIYLTVSLFFDLSRCSCQIYTSVR
jgi:hypothetical protein